MALNNLSARGSLTRKTVVGAAWLVLWRAATRSLGLISTLVLARLLMPADFGLLAMATTFSYGIEGLSQLGLQDALVRRREEGFSLHPTAFTLQLGRGLLTALVIAAMAPAVASWFGEPRLIAVLILLAGVTALNGCENVGIAEFRRTMQFDMEVKLMSAARLGGFLATIGCAVVWRSYTALLAGMLMTSVIRVAMSYWMHPFRPSIQLLHWRELAGFSAWTWAAATASLVWDRCDPFVLGPLFGPAKLGLYLLAMEIAQLPITEIISPAADALFSAFSRARRDGESSLHHAPEVAGVILLGVAPAVLTVSAASGPIVEVILGGRWAAAWPVVAVLSWSCVFSPFSFIGSKALVANGWVRRNFWANVIMSGVKLTALLVAVSWTASPVMIGLVTAGCVAIESVTFLTALAFATNIALRPTFHGLARSVFGLGVASLAIHLAGIGWHGGLGSIRLDLAQGVLIGAMGSLSFGATVLLCWQIAGRPEGAEARLWRLLLIPLARLRMTRRIASV